MSILIKNKGNQTEAAQIELLVYAVFSSKIKST